MTYTAGGGGWVAGLWRAGAPIQYTDVFEQTAGPRLDVSRAGKFFAGNLLTADNPNLVLSIARWDAQGINVEVHNPTAASITATVVTPAEITGYKTFRQTVTVPAGTTIFSGESKVPSTLDLIPGRPNGSSPQ